MIRSAYVVLALATLSTAVPAQSKPQTVTEQRTFNLGADDPVVNHPVQLSDAELAALADDETMHKELDHRDPPIPHLTREGLEAAVIHLNGPNERDLVVVGFGAPFIGANIGPFWVIRDLPAGPQVVFSTIALAITIQKTRYEGLRNIEAFAATATEGTTVNFRFNGRKYVEYKLKSGPLGQ